MPKQPADKQEDVKEVTNEDLLQAFNLLKDQVIKMRDDLKIFKLNFQQSSLLASRRANG